MPTDSPPSFESIFAALGRKLDADPELQCLLSQALARFAAGVVLVPANVEMLPEEPTGEAETATTDVSMPETAPLPPLAVQASTEEIIAPAPTVAASPPASSQDLNTLAQLFTSGRALLPVIPAPRLAGPASLPTIKERLKIKLHALDLARERAEAKLRGERVFATGECYKEVISQARSMPNCYLWMCHHQHDNVSPAQWAEAGECFTVLLRALTLFDDVRGANADRELVASALHLLAEAQSAVRTACDKFDFEDADQVDFYQRLLEWSGSEGIYIVRYMKADDRADPGQCRDLLRRMNDCASEVADIIAARQSRVKLIKKVRYEANALTNNPLQPLENWGKIIASVDQLIVAGLSPSNAELRTILIGHLDDMPAELKLPEGFERFMREVDSYLANQQPEATSTEKELATPEVQKAAEYLKGSDLVMIGGECRDDARRSLINAFGLSDLNWIGTRAHETSSQFESAVARKSVKVVLLAIRWTSHSYGEVKKDCDKYGKQLVRLPGGYGVNQVALQICNQCNLT